MSLSNPAPQPGPVIDVAQAIDDGPVTRFQVGTFVLCSLVALIDGLDSQSIAVTGPAIADQLHLARAALGPVFAAGLLGAMIGALTFGPLADRFGRKIMLVLATVVFATFTLLTAQANSYQTVLAARLAAGIGLGGATPCLLALASEYAPHRRRAALTSLLWSAFPLGTALGAFINGYLLTHFDWQTVFIVGGGLTFVVAAALLAWLPESVRFMAAQGSRHERLRAVLRRIRPELPSDARFAPPTARAAGAPLKQLFTQGRAAGTLLLWVPFFTAFAVLAITVVWTPLLLRDHGIALGQASTAIGINSLGSLIGMASAGWLMERFGAARVIVPALVLGGLATALQGHAAASMHDVLIVTGLAGLFMGIGASGAIALASLTYPTVMRSSGLGWAMGMGRFGQVLAPLLAAGLTARGADGVALFHVFGVAPVVGALAVFAMRWASRSPAPQDERAATLGSMA